MPLVSTTNDNAPRFIYYYPIDKPIQPVADFQISLPIHNYDFGVGRLGAGRLLLRIQQINIVVRCDRTRMVPISIQIGQIVVAGRIIKLDGMKQLSVGIIDMNTADIAV